MVQRGRREKPGGEPPPLGESWWEAALSDESQSRGEILEPVHDPRERIQAGNTPPEIDQPVNDWPYIERLYHDDAIVELTVVGNNQGGLLVQSDQVNGFVPSSHLLHPEDKSAYLQETVNLKVIEYDQERCRVVFSERAAQSRPGERLKLLDTLVEDTCVEGVVTTLTDFGAFVDLGGVEGLIHISELSWGRVGHPSEVVSIGDQVEVYVLNVDRENHKVALSLKKMCDNPWETITERYQPGQTVHAVVKNIVSYGAFVRLEEGVDGLIHVSELGEQGDHLSPWDILKKDQQVEVEIIHLDPQSQRLGLSLESKVL